MVVTPAPSLAAAPGAAGPSLQGSGGAVPGAPVPSGAPSDSSVADARIAGAAAAGSALASAEVAGAPAVADRVVIQPLDLAAALRILLIEVRVELQLPDAPSPAGTATLQGPPTLPSPGQAVQVLLRMLLSALPAPTSDPPVWAAAVAALELKFLSAIDRAVAVVSGWPGVPTVVADAAKEAQALTAGLLRDAPPNFLWLRPEWLGLAPQLERYWRRRRLASRGLTDPDLRSLPEDVADDGDGAPPGHAHEGAPAVRAAPGDAADDRRR